RRRTGKEEHAVYTDDLVGLIQELNANPGRALHCDGGGEIVVAPLQQRLLDIVIISVIPPMLGDGMRLFSDGSPEQSLWHNKSISFPSGLVQLWYEVQVR